MQRSAPHRGPASPDPPSERRQRSKHQRYIALERVPITCNHVTDKDAAQSQRIGACRNPKRRKTFLRTCSHYAVGGRRQNRRQPSPQGSSGVSSPSPKIGRVASQTRSFLQRRDGRRSKALLERNVSMSRHDPDGVAIPAALSERLTDALCHAG